MMRVKSFLLLDIVNCVILFAPDKSFECVGICPYEYVYVKRANQWKAVQKKLIIAIIAKIK